VQGGTTSPETSCAPGCRFPEHNRIVEIEMRDSLGREDERRILHDFVGWRRDARSVEQIGAYRDVVSGFSRTAM